MEHDFASGDRLRTVDEPGPRDDPGRPAVDVASLEGDIAAVGSALESIDRIMSAVGSGEESVGSAAAEIAAVVSAERFGSIGEEVDETGGADSPAGR